MSVKGFERKDGPSYHHRHHLLRPYGAKAEKAGWMRNSCHVL